MSWISFGNGIVAAAFLCALAAICFWGLRALGRKPVAFLVAFAIISVVATIKAQKTNGVPPNVSSPSPQSQQGGVFLTGFTRLTGFSGARSRVPLSKNPVNPVNPVQTTDEDIARGWRVESVATNAAVSYAMPTNGTPVGNWHVHGARSSFGNNRIDFGGWRFPIGTNGAAFSSFWYFIDGRIRPTPKDAAHDITGAAIPISAATANPASHSASPGVKWAASAGAGALLGYCWKAPLDNQGSAQILDDWCANRSPLGDVAAWMKANDRRSGRNACAIRILPSGKIEYRYFRKEGRSWGRNIYTETTEELDL